MFVGYVVVFALSVWWSQAAQQQTNEVYVPRGGSRVLPCTLCRSVKGTDAAWTRRNGTTVVDLAHAAGSLNVDSFGRLHITGAEFFHSGQYICRNGAQTTVFNVTVQGIALTAYVLDTGGMPSIASITGHTINLTVQIGQHVLLIAEVVGIRHTQQHSIWKIRSSTTSLRHRAFSCRAYPRRLGMISASPRNSGLYSFEEAQMSASVQISVEGSPKSIQGQATCSTTYLSFLANLGWRVVACVGTVAHTSYPGADRRSIQLALDQRKPLHKDKSNGGLFDIHGLSVYAGCVAAVFTFAGMMGKLFQFKGKKIEEEPSISQRSTSLARLTKRFSAKRVRTDPSPISATIGNALQRTEHLSTSTDIPLSPSFSVQSCAFDAAEGVSVGARSCKSEIFDPDYSSEIFKGWSCNRAEELDNKVEITADPGIGLIAAKEMTNPLNAQVDKELKMSGKGPDSPGKRMSLTKPLSNVESTRSALLTCNGASRGVGAKGDEAHADGNTPGGDTADEDSNADRNAAHLLGHTQHPWARSSDSAYTLTSFVEEKGEGDMDKESIAELTLAPGSPISPAMLGSLPEDASVQGSDLEAISAYSSDSVMAREMTMMVRTSCDSQTCTGTISSAEPVGVGKVGDVLPKDGNSVAMSHSVSRAHQPGSDDTIRNAMNHMLCPRKPSTSSFDSYTLEEDGHGGISASSSIAEVTMAPGSPVSNSRLPSVCEEVPVDWDNLSNCSATLEFTETKTNDDSPSMNQKCSSPQIIPGSSANHLSSRFLEDASYALNDIIGRTESSLTIRTHTVSVAQLADDEHTDGSYSPAEVDSMSVATFDNSLGENNSSGINARKSIAEITMAPGSPVSISKLGRVLVNIADDGNEAEMHF